jgi:hypothetical protein
LALEVLCIVPMIRNFADAAVLAFFSNIYSVAVFCLKMRSVNQL